MTEAARRLSAAGIEDAALEAEVLFRYVLAATESPDAGRPILDRASFFQRLQDRLSAATADGYEAVLARRLRDEPTAYITGRREFYGLDLVVTPDVLIPRPETEILVEAALAQAHAIGRHNLRIADVGTGSGAIAIALSVALPSARLWATDASVAALAVAHENAARHGVAERIEFASGDLLSPLAEPVDLVAANLPYVPTADWQTLAPEVRDHEPRAALDGGPDGLDVVRRFFQQAPERLRLGGCVLLEFGAGQATALRALAGAIFPGADVSVLRDMAGHERVLVISLLASIA